MERSNPVPVAAVVVTGWIVLEVALRRGLGRGAATAGFDPLLVDYLVLAVGFPLIAGVLTWYALEQGRNRETWGWDWAPRNLGLGVLAAVFGFVLIAGTSQVDAMLFGLDEAGAAVSDGLTAAFEANPALPILFLVGNGVLAPIAEEQVWRGIVQTELVDEWGVAAGIGVTAVLFALKHVVVDLSVVRLTTLLTLGLLFGVVRHRWGTASSTVTHVLLNTVSSASLVAVALS
ncbi:CPBP family intramembrane glutamic endopeptidase [Natrinema caseinilyticum]|uniref:CPBP family intramembrane glutamic endopeptidase n=1 Tax=Natrinema caseinilyticum TaxID=2961570 RepID=UPI0020C3432E|nr:type II CAAX endopeptidase family protein [Natrinema caseinilyticum]